MLDKLQAVEDKYLELESLISDPDIIADMPKEASKDRQILAALKSKQDVIEYRGHLIFIKNLFIFTEPD